MTKTIEEKVAEALFNHEKKTMGDAWYHPSEIFNGLGDESQKPWLAAAKAAIEAIRHEDEKLDENGG